MSELNRKYIANYLKFVRNDINNAIRLIDDKDVQRMLRDANGDLLELKRGLKQ